MNCACDYQEHDHTGVCAKEVRLDNSVNWKKCFKHTFKNIVDDVVQSVEHKDCLCGNNRCCMDCYDKEFIKAKQDIKANMKGFGECTSQF